MADSRKVWAVGPACISSLPKTIRKTLASLEMAGRSTDSLRERVHYLRYAFGEHPQRKESTSQTGPVWQYWHSGYEGAPETIQKCFDSVARWTNGRERILVTEKTVLEYASFPPWVLEKRRSMGQTHFSDLLRVNLLKEHGGTWVDASVYLSGRIDDLTCNPFFAFTRPNDPFLLSNWFMHASKGHFIPTLMAAMLLNYWQSEDRIRDYYLFHYIFEVAFTTNAQFRGKWLGTPVRWHDHPHWLQTNFGRQPGVGELQAAITATAVHKLSYKFDEPTIALLSNCIERVNELLTPSNLIS